MFVLIKPVDYVFIPNLLGCSTTRPLRVLVASFVPVAPLLGSAMCPFARIVGWASSSLVSGVGGVGTALSVPGLSGSSSSK